MEDDPQQQLPNLIILLLGAAILILGISWLLISLTSPQLGATTQPVEVSVINSPEESTTTLRLTSLAPNVASVTMYSDMPVDNQIIFSDPKLGESTTFSAVEPNTYKQGTTTTDGVYNKRNGVITLQVQLENGDEFDVVTYHVANRTN
jgi:hypothetical protein